MGQSFSAIIVESQELFAIGLKYLVSRDRSRMRSHVVTNFGAALQELRPGSHVRLAILDVEAPGMDGASSMNLLRERFPGIRIILTTVRASRGEVLACLSWAVNGVVLRSQSTSEIAGAIRLVMTGGVVVPPVVCERRIHGATGGSGSLRAEAVSDVDDTHPPLPAASGRRANPHLSSRQSEVLRLLARGMSNKAIARELHLSEGTIKVHVAALYRALNVHNRASAIASMTTEGLGRMWHACLLPMLFLEGMIPAL